MKLASRKKEIIFNSILSISMLLSADTFAQRSITSQSQYWLGYMTSTELSHQYSWWNDTHYVPDGFFILRTGLTYTVKKASVTAGYAHAWLPASSSNTDLIRNENRPWAQVQFTLPINTALTFTQRTRYDARFIQNISQGETLDDFTFVNRIRFLGSLRNTFPSFGNNKYKPFIALSDEVLLNFGKNVSGSMFNQNRIYLTLGVQKARTQYQIGYMNRLVLTGTDQYVQNHTVLLWVTQKFSLRKRDQL